MSSRSPGIEEATAAAGAVVVGPVDSCPNRERQLAHARLEDPRHADERNAFAFEVETSLNHRPGKDVVVQWDLLGKPVEHGPADGSVTHKHIPIPGLQPKRQPF